MINNITCQRGSMISRLIVATGVIIACANVSAALAEDEAPLPPIRNFDIPTIEKLGRAMYEHDQLAWRATDILIDKRTQAGAEVDGLRGWVTGKIDGNDVVRFIRIGDHGPEALYDVTFPVVGEPTLTTPEKRELSAEELGQYDA